LFKKEIIVEEVNAVDMTASGDVPILFMETEILLGVLNAFLVSAILMQKKHFFYFYYKKFMHTRRKETSQEKN
jgi:hypothetical protein